MKKFVCIIILFLCTCLSASSQLSDSLRNTAHAQSYHVTDSVFIAGNQIHLHETIKGYEVMDSLIRHSMFCSAKNNPIVVSVAVKKINDPRFVFYFLLGTAIFLGLLKTVYHKYFTNLLRVFFNTSLRQSQLTDQLLQSKLPAFMYSIVFYLTGGQYIYHLLYKSGHVHGDNLFLMIVAVMSLAMIYLFKFAAIRTIGWVSGYRSDAILYQFIVSLTNNIITILLLPLLFLIAFSEKWLSDLVVNLSFFILGLIFLFRYIRAFGNLQRDLKLDSFHFVLYIISLEIIPLLLLYKIGWSILTNYL